MTTKQDSDARIVSAALDVSTSVWELALALADGVRKTSSGHVEKREWPRIVKLLADAGATTQSGKPYAQRTLRDYHDVAVWTNKNVAVGSQIRKYPLQRVIMARRDEKTHGKTLAALKSGKTLTQLRNPAPHLRPNQGPPLNSVPLISDKLQKRIAEVTAKLKLPEKKLPAGTVLRLHNIVTNIETAADRINRLADEGSLTDDLLVGIKDALDDLTDAFNAASERIAAEVS